ncbi:MAG: 30S ribosomal protein S9 [Patescibacteria group bacterium]|nr:30S ribosomal protein S9 [Patescibacteria group bacterium]
MPKRKTAVKAKAKSKAKSKITKKKSSLAKAKGIKKKEVKKKKGVKKEKAAKKKTKKEKPKKAKVEKEIKTDRFYEAVGKRKTAVARVRVWTRGEGFLVNQKSLKEYFPISELQKVALSSLEKMKAINKFKISILVRGGGISSQAEAIRHGLAKVLVLFNPEFRKRLKKAGFLRRDARMRERKKFGLKRARRAPQWKKR